MLTRRSIVFGGVGALTACTRPKAKGFSGYAFIANSDGGAIAAVDLEVFAVARHIPVDGSPTAVVARERRARVYALTPENGSVHEIRSSNLTFASKLQVARSAITMRLSPSHRNCCIAALGRELARKLVALAFEPMRVDWELPASGRSDRFRYFSGPARCSLSAMGPRMPSALSTSLCNARLSRWSGRQAKSGWCAFSRERTRAS